MIPLSRPDIGPLELSEICQSFFNRRLARGQKVEKFEKEIEKEYNYNHVITTNSGTAALDLAIKSLNLEGSEIICPAITWISTAMAGVYNDYDICWVDVQKSTLNISPEDLAHRISQNTAAVMVVHYGGQPADMENIISVAKDYNAAVIEDAAHAFGASYNGVSVGKIGDVGCFSFQESKPLTTGEGGAVVTDNQSINEECTTLKQMGLQLKNVDKNRCQWQYDIVDVGYKYILNDVSAAIGLAQLHRYDQIKSRRKDIAEIYNDAFDDVSWIETLDDKHNRTNSHFNYTMLVSKVDRDDMIDYLYQNNIMSTVHYEPLYRHSVFDQHEPDLPTTEEVWPKMITLPMSSTLSPDEVQRVIDTVVEYGS